MTPTLALLWACLGTPTETDTHVTADDSGGPTETGDDSPAVADLTDAVALVLLEGDDVLSKQLPDDTIAPVLPSDTHVMWFVTTDTLAYVSLTEPIWVGTRAAGQWCTVLVFDTTDRGPTELGCIARTVESDPTVPSTSNETAPWLLAYDDKDVWVGWRYGKDGNGQEMWGYRDGVGTAIGPIGILYPRFAIEGALVVEEGVLYRYDEGGIIRAEAVPILSYEGWGPYHYTKYKKTGSYGLFRLSEGETDLQERMDGDPYCRDNLSDSNTDMGNDGPNLLVHVGSEWDHDPKVPATYCRCSLDFDCQLVSEDHRAALDAAGDVVGAQTTEGIGYAASAAGLVFLHDGMVSHDFITEVKPERFWQWGHDLYVSVGFDFWRVDWSGDDAVLVEIPRWGTYGIAQLVRLPEP
jgi:hypothetical protein